MCNELHFNLPAIRKISKAILDSIKTLDLNCDFVFAYTFLYFQCSLLFCLTLSVIFNIAVHTNSLYFRRHFLVVPLPSSSLPKGQIMSECIL